MKAFPLKTDLGLRMLRHREQIPKDASCYGNRVDGTRGWCKPGTLVGKRWNRYSPSTPAIIMTKKGVKK